MTSWPPPGPVPLPGAHVSGWSANVLDFLIGKFARPFLPLMSPGQRQEFEAAARAIQAAAELWRGTAVDGNTAVPSPAVPRSSMRDEVDTSRAAELLGVSERRVRQLAAAWQPEGLARRVGRSWLLDAAAVQLEADRRRPAA